MTTALVLAASSFIGRHLCASLVDQGHRVHPTVRSRSPGDPEARLCDLTRKDEVARAIAETRPDWIIQCAGATHAPDPEDLYRLHVGGALNLLTAIRDHAPRAVTVFFGSAAEYGDAPSEALPLPETYPGSPSGFFGASKLAQTDLVRAAAREWQLRALIARPANVVGPGLPGHYLAAALAKRLRAAETGKLEVPNVTATRDFVDVRDVARAVRLLLEKAPPTAGRCEIYNIATGTEAPVLEVARLLGDLAGGVQAVDAGNAGSRTGIQRSALSPAKLTRATGWSPEISLGLSLADLWHEN